MRGDRDWVVRDGVEEGSGVLWIGYGEPFSPLGAPQKGKRALFGPRMMN